MRSWLYVVCTAYILCLWPVTSQENKNCKPGRCPAYKGGRICPEQFDIQDECISDFECTGNKKCCSDGCELKCLAPASDDTKPKPNDLTEYCKAGECPVYPIREDCPHFWQLQDDCYFDFQCPKDQKCCSDGCELRCMAIQKENETTVAPTAKATGSDPTKDAFIGNETGKPTTVQVPVTFRPTTEEEISGASTPVFPARARSTLPAAGIYHFGVVIQNTYRYDVLVTTTLKDTRYKAISIPGRQKYTIEIKVRSLDPILITARNPSGQPELVNNAYSQQISGTILPKAPQTIFIGRAAPQTTQASTDATETRTSTDIVQTQVETDSRPTKSPTEKEGEQFSTDVGTTQGPTDTDTTPGSSDEKTTQHTTDADPGKVSTDAGTEEVLTDAGVEQDSTDAAAEQVSTDAGPGTSEVMTDDGPTKPATGAMSTQAFTDSTPTQRSTDAGAEQVSTDAGEKKVSTDSGAEQVSTAASEVMTDAGAEPVSTDAGAGPGPGGAVTDAGPTKPVTDAKPTKALTDPRPPKRVGGVEGATPQPPVIPQTASSPTNISTTEKAARCIDVHWLRVRLQLTNSSVRLML